MVRARLVEEFEIEVGGDPYVWWLQRHPKWARNPAERHGMAIGARHLEGQRDAVIEFPPSDVQPRFGAPQLKPGQISVKLVARAIESAVAAGWDPLSRGKTVNVAVDAEGG